MISKLRQWFWLDFLIFKIDSDWLFLISDNDSDGKIDEDCSGAPLSKYNKNGKKISRVYAFKLLP